MQIQKGCRRDSLSQMDHHGACVMTQKGGHLEQAVINAAQRIVHTLGEEQFADARQQVIRVETVVSKPTLRLHELTKLQRLLVIVFLAEFEVFPPATLDELLRPF